VYIISEESHDTKSEYVHNGQESGHNGVYVYTKSPFLDITVDLIRNDCAVKTVKMLPTIE